MNRRLIGESLPLRLISMEATAEKQKSQNHISTIHLWFARRPLTASRATAYAALIDPTKVDRRSANKTLIELSYYKNGENKSIIEKARRHILKCNNMIPPKVLDPFGGGGAIPLECMRLGCETYSNDYNPVAYMIQKCTLEYPLKYGRVSGGTNVSDSKLIRDIQKWSKWVEDEAYKDLKEFYPNTKNGTPSEYLWARTIPCMNPKCGATIPILTSYLLDQKNNISMYPVIQGKKIMFRVVGGKYEKVPPDHDIGGNSTGNYVTCQRCHNTIKPKDTNKLLRQSLDEQMVIVVERPSKGKKTFAVPTTKDIKAYDACRKKLAKTRQDFIEKYTIDPIPTEPIEMPDGQEYNNDGIYWVFNCMSPIGYTKYNHLYNNRQQLALITLLYKIKDVYTKIYNEDRKYAECIISYLCVMIDKLTARFSRMAVWLASGCYTHTHLSGSAIKKIVWYSEVNPFDKKTGIQGKIHAMCGGIMQAIKADCQPVKNITRFSATKLEYPNDYFDAVFTDPPYYDFVAYADFSDYFYVWLKRGLGHIFPDIFKTRLTPKRQELVANDKLLRGNKNNIVSKKELNLKNKQYYEDGMAEAISEMYRVTKPNGIITLVYTHSSLDGWETLIKAIKRSGFVITAAWPLSTETASRMSARDKASIQSSIYMVGRKWDRENVGFYTDVKKDMFNSLKIKLKEFGGTLNKTDYFIAAIGFALEWFTKYEKVLEDSGKEVTICRMLEDIRKFTIDYKMEELVGSKLAESGIARLYVMYRWQYGDKSAPYDDARKIFQGCGVNIDEHYGGIVQKRRNEITILGPFERGDINSIPEDNLINILHKAILYRETDKKAECNIMLEKHGYIKSETFKNIVLAIARVQDIETKEVRRLKSMLESTDMHVETLDSHMYP